MYLSSPRRISPAFVDFIARAIAVQSCGTAAFDRRGVGEKEVMLRSGKGTVIS